MLAACTQLFSFGCADDVQTPSLPTTGVFVGIQDVFELEAFDFEGNETSGWRSVASLPGHASGTRTVEVATVLGNEATAIVRSGSALFVARLDGSTTLVELPTEHETLVGPVVSDRDSQRIAYAADGGAFVMSLSEDEVPLRVADLEPDEEVTTFTTDGRFLFTRRPGAGVRIVATDGSSDDKTLGVSVIALAESYVLAATNPRAGNYIVVVDPASGASEILTSPGLEASVVGVHRDYAVLSTRSGYLGYDLTGANDYRPEPVLEADARGALVHGDAVFYFHEGRGELLESSLVDGSTSAVVLASIASAEGEVVGADADRVYAVIDGRLLRIDRRGGADPTTIAVDVTCRWTRGTIEGPRCGSNSCFLGSTHAVVPKRDTCAVVSLADGHERTVPSGFVTTSTGLLRLTRSPWESVVAVSAGGEARTLIPWEASRSRSWVFGAWLIQDRGDGIYATQIEGDRVLARIAPSASTMPGTIVRSDVVGVTGGHVIINISYLDTGTGSIDRCDVAAQNLDGQHAAEMNLLGTCAAAVGPQDGQFIVAQDGLRLLSLDGASEVLSTSGDSELAHVDAARERIWWTDRGRLIASSNGDTSETAFDGEIDEVSGVFDSALVAVSHRSETGAQLTFIDPSDSTPRKTVAGRHIGPIVIDDGGRFLYSDQRSIYAGSMADEDGGGTALVTDTRGSWHAPTRAVAAATTSTRMFILNTDGSRIRFDFDDLAPQPLAWSVDSGALAYQDGDTLYEIDVNAGSRREVGRASGRVLRAVGGGFVFDRDDLLYFAGNGAEARTLSVDAALYQAIAAQ